MKQDLICRIDATAVLLQGLYSSLSQEQLNQVPFSGSWTAGQVADHLLKACSVDILYGNTSPSERDPTAVAGKMEKLFMDFSIKMDSPAFIYPESRQYQKDAICADLKSCWLKIREAADSLDLTRICLDFDFPGFGLLTRFEWLSFLVVHTQRHLHQLRNIRSGLTEKAAV